VNLPSVTVLEFVGMASFGFNLLVVGVAWVMSRQKASLSQIDDLAAETTKRLNNHGERITRLEVAQETMPNKEEISKLAIEMKELEGSIKALTEKMGGFENISKLMKNQVDVMDAYLRKMK
jgi:phosphomevalonate kinase